MPLAVALHDLQKCRRLRDQLERAAYLFERFGGDCRGECDFPVQILSCEATGDVLHCCNLRPIWERYCDTKRLEKLLEYKVNAARRDHAALDRAYADSTPAEAGAPGTRSSPSEAAAA